MQIPVQPARRRLHSLVAMLAVAAASVAGAARAAVPWHTDLAQAKAASQVSRRPVLILFVATWSEASMAHDRTFLATDEAVALLTACFEPVRIDVDADKVTPRRLDVQHVPCACVVDTDERLLSRFDCPESSAAFVAAAGRAAQDAAVACAGPLTPALAPSAAPMPGPVPQPAVPPAAGTATSPVAAGTATSPVAAGTATSPVAAGTATSPVAADPAAPALDTAPPAWPAVEPEPGPVGNPILPAVASGAVTTSAGTIEPRSGAADAAAAGAINAAAAAPATTAPWLTPKPTAPAAPTPAVTATEPALPPTPPATPAATAAEPEPEKKSGGFWAAVQKPFGSLLGKPSKPSVSAPATVEMPSTTVPGGDPGAPSPLGLEGYCAVSLVEKGSWVEGRAKWGVRHRGRTYLCAGPDEQRAFLADPDRFAPGLSGDDPVLAFDNGKRVTGQRQYGVSYRSRIYLFSSPDTQAAFRVDPQRAAQRVQLAEQPAGSTTVR